MNEDSLHKCVAQYLKFRLPEEVVWFHCPNGGKRNIREAAKLKLMGTLAGVYDLIFFLPGPDVRVIELKVDGGYLSKTQKEFRDRCEAIGIKTAVCRSVDEVKDVLECWGIP